MSKFIIEAENSFKLNEFIDKLKLNFNTVNAKNVLLQRRIKTFEYDNKKLIYVEMKPLIPNVPLVIAGITGFIKLVLFFIGKSYFLLDLAFSIFLVMSFFWTKYFFVLLFRNALNKYGIKEHKLI